LNTGVCKLESSQIDESIAQSADSAKAYGKPNLKAFNRFSSMVLK